MLRIIAGMPADVLAIEAVGEVTQEDYRGILIPKAEAMMTKGPIKMPYVIGKEFTGYELEALWEDGTFGIKHWREFTRGVCARVPARLEAGWAIPSVGRIPDDGQDTSSPWLRRG